VSGFAPATVLVGGGAGFIGSHFARLALAELGEARVVVYDKLTYAGNPDNIADLLEDPRFSFVRGDIADAEALRAALQGCDAIVNFAAETHVDRSIVDPEAFLATDVMGTFRLMEAARDLGIGRVVQVSTDEVYGSVAEGSATEDWPLRPSSPYSASKASGDLVALSFHMTYGTPVCVTRGSNTYGPNQYPEKLIPLFVTNALEGERLPVYGDGLQRRDWLHVDDHARGVLTVLAEGEPGQVYNIGGGNERTNLEITRGVLAALGLDEGLISHVEDRPGHDRRYSIDASRLRGLGWAPRVAFEDGLAATVAWYRDNPEWWRRLKDHDSFRRWQSAWYSGRA
jgi:dTDP-glucose 4,6-dehydratase